MCEIVDFLSAYHFRLDISNGRTSFDMSRATFAKALLVVLARTAFSFSHHQTTAELPPTVGDVIIGSGITGASLAYNILSQSAATSVLMLEARAACSNATGRNGGHTKHAAYREFLENLQCHGEEQAAKILRFETECMGAVHAFAKAHSIECDSWQEDTVDVFYDQGQLEKAKKAVGEIRRVLGEDDPSARYQFWDAEETKKTFLVEWSYGAVSMRPETCGLTSS